MKTLSKIVLLAFLAISGYESNAQCPTPNFTYTVSPGGLVNFYNYGIYDSLGIGSNVIWNFGDGDTSHSVSYALTHTYASAGTYNVSLEIILPGTSCDVTVSQNITLTLCSGAAQVQYNQIGFGNFQFSGAGLASLTGATAFWDFGDGTTSTTLAPVHQYTTSGDFNVCLTVADATLGCADTACRNGNYPYPVYVSLCQFAVLTYDSAISYNPVDMQFSTSPVVAGYNYQWNFGDGGTGSGSTVTHTYTSSGVYVKSLTISDAITGCSETFNESLNINLCGLNAYIGNNGNGLTQTFYANVYDSLPVTITNYVWSFPGATPSSGTGSSVSGITYPTPGTYTACAYFTTNSGCIDTVCQPLTVTPPSYSISGSVTKSSGGSGFLGTVYLIKQDSIGHLALVDSFVSNYDSIPTFYYTFYNLSPDTFYVKAALGSLDADYAAYLPTYYGDVLTWGAASLVPITNNSASGIDINLVAGSNPGGPGFVGGYVSQGAGLVIGSNGSGNGRSVGEALQGVQINLLTAAGSPVAYTYTDINGHYSFAHLALGSYKIYVEQLNKIPSPLDFTLTAENPVDSSANMSINSTTTTGVNDINSLQINEVYPNPVSSIVQLKLSAKQASDASLKMIDVLGRVTLEQKLKLNIGENTAAVNMEQLTAGVYQMTIQTEAGQITYKLVKAK